MRFRLEIDMENDAFSNGGALSEVRRILKAIPLSVMLHRARKYQDYDATKLRDSNGNTVGFARVEE